MRWPDSERWESIEEILFATKRYFQGEIYWELNKAVTECFRRANRKWRNEKAERDGTQTTETAGRFPPIHGKEHPQAGTGTTLKKWYIISIIYVIDYIRMENSSVAKISSSCNAPPVRATNQTNKNRLSWSSNSVSWKPTKLQGCITNRQDYWRKEVWTTASSSHFVIHGYT